MTELTETPPPPFPRCDLCQHPDHGLPCTKGVGTVTVWGMPAQPTACGCPGAWGGAAA